MRKYYKVVTDNLTSVVQVPPYVKYKLNKFVRPSDLHSKLFIFDTLKNAQKFTNSRFGRYKMYECHATNVTKPVNALLSGITWIKYNKLKKQKKSVKCINNTSMYWPEGTLWARSVKLTKLIQ